MGSGERGGGGGGMAMEEEEEETRPEYKICKDCADGVFPPPIGRKDGREWEMDGWMCEKNMGRKNIES